MAADSTIQRPDTSGRGLFQRRFTRTMSVRNRMLVNVLILFVPLVALGFSYVGAAQKTLSSSNAEVAGLKLIDPWTGKAQESRAASATALPTRAAASPAGESEWNEF